MGLAYGPVDVFPRLSLQGLFYGFSNLCCQPGYRRGAVRLALQVMDIFKNGELYT